MSRVDRRSTLSMRETTTYKNTFLGILILVLTQLNTAYSQDSFKQSNLEYITYTIKEGDNLSEIAFRYCRKVYGSKGLIKIIRDTNPLLNLEKAIIPSTTIKIPTDKSLCILPHNTTEESENSKTSHYPISKEQKNKLKKVEEKTNQEKAGRSKYSVSIQTGSKQFKSQDDDNYEAIINSSSYVELFVKEETFLNEDLSTSFYGSVEYLDFDKSDNLRINNSKKIKKSFGFSSTYHRKNINYTFLINLKERTRFASSTNRVINITASTPVATGLQIESEIYNKKTKVSLGANYIYLFEKQNSGVGLKSGFEYQLYTKFDFIKHAWLLSYQYSEQNSDLYKAQNNLLSLMYSWSFY